MGKLAVFFGVLLGFIFALFGVFFMVTSSIYMMVFGAIDTGHDDHMGPAVDSQGQIVTLPGTGAKWTRPLDTGRYYVSCGWGCYPGHQGVDMAAREWTPIYAASAGTVDLAGMNGGMGNAVRIVHPGGYTTVYMHMVTRPLVKAGDTVKAGQNIGYVGSTGYSTGPHLHFEVHYRGVKAEPESFMRQIGLPL